MSKHLLMLLKKSIYPLILTFIIGVISGANITHATFLTGWDSLHPEFDFPLAFNRAISGVWRGYQGLGAVAGHSHMADLPRIFLLWAMSLAVPMVYLRYVFILLSLLAGVLGVYKLGSYIFKDNKYFKSLAFISALFYLTNLGTLQHFAVPFEMFIVQFALLPWILLASYLFVQSPTPKMLLFFILITIFASPMAYAATLWYGFFVCYILFIILLTWKKKIKTGIILILITVAINLYWILPNLYFVANHGQEVADSKINQLFSPEAFAKNQEFGTLPNALILKNFLFDWQLYNAKTNQFEDVLGPWLKHLNNPLVLGIGYSFFALSLLGLIQAIKTKNKVALALLPFYLIPFFMLLNGTWPVNIAFNKLGELFPLAKEALRFPFTKFSILYMMAFSVYAGLGVAYLTTRNRVEPYFRLIIIAISAGSLFYFYPAFQGNLIQPAMRVNIPKEYFEMFDWFKSQDHDQRVAILPIHSFWGWTYYDWGYQGAGFLQFGIPQPILDRDYDRWSPFNEQYQKEMAYAVYSQNPETIRQVLEKYAVRFILVDTSIISPGSISSSTLTWLLPQLLTKIPGVKETTRFGDHIIVYNYDAAPQSQASIYSNLSSIGPPMSGASVDNAFYAYGPYLTADQNSIIDNSRADFNREERYLGTPNSNPIETVTAVQWDKLTKADNCGAINLKSASTRTLTKTNELNYLSADTSICDHLNFPSLDHANGYLLEITSRNSVGFPLQMCLTNNLTSHCDLFVHLGKQAQFQVERFYLPPLSDFGQGYTLNLKNFAIAGSSSANQIKSVKIYQTDELIYTETSDQMNNISIKTDVLTQKITPFAYRVVLKELLDDTVLTFYQSYEKGWRAYIINAKCQMPNARCNFLQPTTYNLQLFFPFLFGREIKDHVLVNNWANGWTIDRQTIRQEDNKNIQDLTVLPSQSLTVVVFFLPQLLQYLGWGLGIVAIIICFNKKLYQNHELS